MKTGMFASTLCAVLAIGALAFASADVKLKWDANASDEKVTKYTIYEKIGSTYNKLIDVDAATACVNGTCSGTLTNVTPGVHTYVATASNMWGESGYSNEVSTPPAATAPRNIIITITITITP